MFIMNLGSLDKWIADKGDDTLRLNYDLMPSSLVWDIGAYHGEWAERIFAKYGCRIDCFEPIKGSFQYALRKFGRNEKIRWFNFALSDETRTAEIHEEKNCSSFHIEGGDRETVEIRDVVQAWNAAGKPVIDLCKINIEGDEYKLLRRLSNYGIIDRFRELQIQFHILDAKSEADYMEMQMILSRTHRQTWVYPFVWENWKLK
jgi:FkbM family methyltransferase